ncbi:hypothetical protein [Roseitranquillus sediminis]|uniref:hypothetical protein n=1 Tax=Roseitranquillus sediminis TaxID=2809051 RepID=UPI001D0C1C6B|nr:hypothetical protein [Roseitranquillus sediminis]MBM9596462.1 hypothetical protein [Roseitranquillus sediminis]
MCFIRSARRALAGFRAAIVHRRSGVLGAARDRNDAARWNLRSAVGDLLRRRTHPHGDMRAFLIRAFGRPERKLPDDLEKMLKRLREEEQRQI